MSSVLLGLRKEKFWLIFCYGIISISLTRLFSLSGSIAERNQRWAHEFNLQRFCWCNEACSLYRLEVIYRKQNWADSSVTERSTTNIAIRRSLAVYFAHHSLYISHFFSEISRKVFRPTTWSSPPLKRTDSSRWLASQSDPTVPMQRGYIWHGKCLGRSTSFRCGWCVCLAILQRESMIINLRLIYFRSRKSYICQVRLPQSNVHRSMQRKFPWHGFHNWRKNF